MANLADKLVSINTSKTAIRQAIVSKGVSMPTGLPFSGYAEKIKMIETGTGTDATSLIKVSDSVNVMYIGIPVYTGIDRVRMRDIPSSAYITALNEKVSVTYTDVHGLGITEQMNMSIHNIPTVRSTVSVEYK